MIRLWRPLATPRADLPGGLPLAGSAGLRFDRVAPAGDAPGVAVPATRLDAAERDLLSALRPPICGLTLDRPRIMGILNVTPDSFSDGGDLGTVMAALERARAMVRDGADILDIGGESTRPGAAEVPVAAEIARVVPVIAAIRAAGIVTPISVDTRKAAVAEAAIAAGANMVNDVSAMRFDPDMAACIATAGVPVCLMHAQGDPARMQHAPRYDDVLAEVFAHLVARIAAAEAAGIARGAILVDPGIGFGKTVQHNVTLLQGISLYHATGCAILLGASRKRFIGALGGGADTQPKDRMAGSLAVALHAAAQGAQVMRVHDVAATRQALSLQAALTGQDQGLDPGPNPGRDRDRNTT